MRCEKCGNPLEQGAVICNKCGARVYTAQEQAEKDKAYADLEAQERFLSYMEENQPMVQGGMKKFKKKRKMAPIIVAVAAVVVVALGVGGVFAYPTILRTVSPQAYMNYAQGKTDKALAKDMEKLNDAWGNTLIEQIKDGVASRTIKADFKDMNIGMPDVDQMLQQMYLTVNSVKDPAKKKMSASVEVGAMGASFKAEGYLTEDDLTVKIPTLLDAIKVSDKDFAAKWNESNYAVYFGEMGSDIKFDFADLFKDEESYYNSIVKDWKGKTKDLLDKHTTFEKGPKAAVEGAGGQEYYQFIYTIDPQAFTTLIKDMQKDMTAQTFSGVYSFLTGAIDEQSKKEMMDQLLKELDQLSFSNIKITVYADSQDRVVGETFTFDVSYGSETINVAVDMVMRGKDSLLDDIYLNVAAKEGDNKIGFTIESKGNHAMKDGKFSDESKLTFVDNNSTETASLSIQWDSNLAKDNLSVALDIPSADVNIKLVGNYLVDQTQKKVSAAISQLKVQGLGESSLDLKLNISYELAYANPEDVKAITDDAKDLFDAESVQKIEQLIMQLGSQMGGGSTDGDIPDAGDDFSDFSDEDFSDFVA